MCVIMGVSEEIAGTKEVFHAFTDECISDESCHKAGGHL